MKNAMQLKAIVKNIAREKKISAILVLQNYMLERFLDSLTTSSQAEQRIFLFRNDKAVFFVFPAKNSAA